MFNDFFKSLLYNPKVILDFRSDALDFINNIKTNPARLSMDGFIEENLLRVKVIKTNLLELISIMFESKGQTTSNVSLQEEYVKLINNKLAYKDDSIYKQDVLKLIQEGLNAMSSSRDPFHDLAHIKRLIKLAKIYFAFLRITTDIDWGSLVLAVIYHDISRVKHLGTIYDKKFLKFLEKIPFIVDATLVKQLMTDAERSHQVFIKKANKLKLKHNIIQNVEAGILGTAFNQDQYATKYKKNIYFKILNDIDTLDMFTVGRFETGLHNVKVENMASQKYFNRATFLVSIKRHSYKANLQITFSKPIFDFFNFTLIQYGKKFYPAKVKSLIA